MKSRKYSTDDIVIGLLVSGIFFLGLLTHAIVTYAYYASKRRDPQRSK